MLIIAGKIKIQADKHDQAVAIALEMAAATQQEEGCIEYQFYEDLSEPNTFLIFERWESDEHLAAHFNTPHMVTFRKALPSLVAGRGNLYKYEVASHVKL
ncbi:MAG: putative quinol monooxygenase [Candidatus Promineifilaceae bacterium]